MDNIKSLIGILNAALEHTPPATKEILTRLANENIAHISKAIEAAEKSVA